jgi:hypothetical protein
VAKSQTNYATNAGNTLENTGAGLTNALTPGLTSYLGGLGGAQGTQGATGATLTSALDQNLSTGGYNPSQLAGLTSETNTLAQTGGFTPTQTSTLNQGGYDPTQLANLSTAQGGYSNLASNGGFTPAQAQGFVRQATEGTTDTYNTLSQQAQQDRAATGGLGTGGEVSQMARQLGQAQASNTLNAETQLNQLQTANTVTGLGGLASTANQVAGNTIAGQTAIEQGKQQGTAQQLGLAGNVAAGATSAASTLNSLYNTQTGQVTAMGSQLLQALGLGSADQGTAIAALTNLSKNPGAFQTALSDTLGIVGTANDT